MSFTIHRTVAFMENMQDPQFGTAFAKIWVGFGSHLTQVISVLDIESFALKALIDEQ